VKVRPSQNTGIVNAKYYHLQRNMLSERVISYVQITQPPAGLTRFIVCAKAPTPVYDLKLVQLITSKPAKLG